MTDVLPSIKSRQSLRDALEHVSRLGLSPTTVVDVGAAYGTPELYEVFPAARHILIEPLEEYRPHLDYALRQLPNAEYVIAAATSQPGTVTVNVHADLVGSSMYVETEQSPGLNDTPRVVPGVTLDTLCGEREAQGPYLLKIDVQGAELDVLGGASRVLENTEYAILETSLFSFYRNGVQLPGVIAYMAERGFVPYDIVGQLYRPLDGALAQLDVAFVPEGGRLRASHSYATPAQRVALTHQLLGLGN